MSELSDLSFQDAWDAVLDGMMVVSSPGRILYANQAACDLFRASASELYEAGKSGAVYPEDPRWDALVAALALSGRATGLVSLLRGDGTEFLAELSLTSFGSSEPHDLLCAVVRDVTRRTRRERRLVAYEEITQAILGDASATETMDLVSTHACRIFEAGFACITVPASTGSGVVVLSAHGTGGEDLVGRTFPSGGPADPVMASGEPRLVDPVTPATELSERWQVLIRPGMIVPMAVQVEAIGALCLGGKIGLRPYGAEDLAMAVQYAEGAAAALEMGRSRRERERSVEVTAAQLQLALDSRVVIEEAKGFVAALRGVSVEDAFGLIRQYARSHNQRVQAVAGQIVDRRLVV